MLSLGTGISLSSYVVQANEANNATLISQSSSSSSNSQTSESQSSSPNSSILANSEATSVSSTEKLLLMIHLLTVLPMLYLKHKIQIPVLLPVLLQRAVKTLS